MWTIGVQTHFAYFVAHIRDPFKDDRRVTQPRSISDIVIAAKKEKATLRKPQTLPKNYSYIGQDSKNYFLNLSKG